MCVDFFLKILVVCVVLVQIPRFLFKMKLVTHNKKRMRVVLLMNIIFTTCLDYGFVSTFRPQIATDPIDFGA